MGSGSRQDRRHWGRKALVMASNITVNFESKKAQKFFQNLVKNERKITDRQKDYVDTISAFVFKDIHDHFEKEMGSEGKRWPEWSEAYTKHMIRKGKGANFILQDTRHMFNSFKPTSWRKANRGILWFNNAKTKTGFPYAGMHNDGGTNEQGNKVPQRRFMWLSKKAMGEISAATEFFLLRGK